MEGKMKQQPKIEMEIVGGPPPQSMDVLEAMYACERVKLRALIARLQGDLK
jgi:rRNA processing protein Krr1/Pno1